MSPHLRPRALKARRRNHQATKVSQCSSRAHPGRTSRAGGKKGNKQARLQQGNQSQEGPTGRGPRDLPKQSQQVYNPPPEKRAAEGGRPGSGQSDSEYTRRRAATSSIRPESALGPLSATLHLLPSPHGPRPHAPRGGRAHSSKSRRRPGPKGDKIISQKRARARDPPGQPSQTDSSRAEAEHSSPPPRDAGAASRAGG